MKTHDLKTDSAVFQAVWDGKKTFEIRKDDRGFQVGDVLRLHETVYTGEEMKPKHDGGFPGTILPGKPLQYTGRICHLDVTHILCGPIYGLAEGWVILSLAGAEGSAVDRLHEQVSELKSEVKRLQQQALDGAQYDALEYGRNAYLQGLERAAYIADQHGATLGSIVASGIRAETGGDQSELATLRTELEQLRESLAAALNRCALANAARDNAQEENARLQAVLKEVSGCHTEHNTPKLCEGCLISIAEVQH